MRKKLISAGKKRVRVMLATLVMGVSVSLLPVYASSPASKDFPYGNNINAYLHTYVSFLEGTLWITDKVWCNMSLNGTDAACTKATYKLCTDKKTISSNCTLSYKNLSDSYTKKSAGYGGSYAYVEGVYAKYFYVNSKYTK